MFIWTAKFPALKTLVLLLGAAIAAVAFFALRVPPSRSDEAPVVLETNADRVEYLRALGWEVEEEPIETYEFLLPAAPEEPYLSYNALQLPQGFDLTPHYGEAVSRYTYAVKNHPNRETGVQANLYLCGGIPVAGDIFCPGANGFQEALVQAPR